MSINNFKFKLLFILNFLSNQFYSNDFTLEAKQCIHFLFKHLLYSILSLPWLLRVGSHRLRIQVNHHIAREDRVCTLCTLVEAGSQIHFLFKCPIYYEIRGRFYCLFRDCRSLSDFFRYTDQHCITLYLRESLQLRDHTLQLSFPRSQIRAQLITTFFSPLTPAWGVKQSYSFPNTGHSKLVRPCRGPFCQGHSSHSTQLHHRACGSRIDQSLLDFFPVKTDT